MKRILFILTMFYSVLSAQTYEPTHLYISDSMKVGTSTNSVWISEASAGSIIIKYLGREYKMDGNAEYVALDSLESFTVSAQGKDTALITAVGFDPEATNYQLRYLEGLVYPTFTTGTLVLSSTDSSAFKDLKVVIDVPTDNTNYAFKLFSQFGETPQASNSDTTQLDSIGAVPITYDPTNFYVNNLTGDNSNTGTHPDTAWATLAYTVAQSMSPNDSIFLIDTCVFRTGYDDSGSDVGRLFLTWNGTRDNHIVLTSYDTDGDSDTRPRILGSDTITTWTQVGATDVWWGYDTDFTTAAIETNGRVWFELTDSIAWGDPVASIAAVDSLYDYYLSADEDTLYVFAGSDPSSAFASVEIPWVDSPIWFENGASDTSSYITINGLELAYTTTHTMRTGWPGGMASGRNQEGINVSYCYMHHAGYPEAAGAYAIDILAPQSVYEYNTVSDMGRRGLSFNASSSYRGTSMDSIIIRHNYIQAMWHSGVDIISNTSVPYSYFWIYGNVIEEDRNKPHYGDDYDAIGVYLDPQVGAGAYTNFYVYNNILINISGNAMQYGDDVDSLWIVNNTFYGTNENLLETRTFIARQGSGTGGTPVYIYNNVMHTIDPPSILGFQVAFNTGQTTVETLDYNMYYNSNGAPEDFINYNNTWYNMGNFATYVSTHSEDVNSPTPADSDLDVPAYPDPFRWVWPTSPDWSPNVSSPTVGTGTPISWITTDFYGNARDGATPDIGAIERQ